MGWTNYISKNDHAEVCSLENLQNILKYYIEGIMNDYEIKDREKAESILANALETEEADIAITERISHAMEGK